MKGGGIDVLLSAKMAMLPPDVDRFVLVSGNSDFIPLLQVLGQKGLSTIVVGLSPRDEPGAYRGRDKVHKSRNRAGRSDTSSLRSETRPGPAKTAGRDLCREGAAF